MFSLSSMYEGLTHPAGNPGTWREAARAWRRLATELAGTGDDLYPVVRTLGEPSWVGAGRDAFHGYWVTSLQPEFGEQMLARYRHVADQLDETAGKIEEYNQLVQALELALATGAIISAATAGLGTIFGAGRVAAAAAEVVAAQGALRVFFGLLARTMITYLKFWTITFSFSLVTNAFAIALLAPDHDPLNMQHWSLRGLAEAANGATVSGVLGAAGTLASVRSLAVAHPLGFNLGTGAIAGAAPSAYNFLGLEHRKLSDAWWRIALMTTSSTVWTAGMGKVFAAKPPGAVPVSAKDLEDWTTTSTGLHVPPPAKNWLVTKSGRLVPKVYTRFSDQDPLIKSSMLGFVPNTAIRSIVPLSPAKSAPADLPPPSVSEGVAGPPALHLPPPFHPHRPPTVGGGTYTVCAGESLWAIAGGRLGDPSWWTRIAAANPQIVDPALIHPGEVIHIPTLPAPRSAIGGCRHPTSFPVRDCL